MTTEDKQQPPICVECKHKGWVLCLRPIPSTFDLVFGGVHKSLDRDLYDERKRSWFRDTCGPEGKYWEAKSPILDANQAQSAEQQYSAVSPVVSGGNCLSALGPALNRITGG